MTALRRLRPASDGAPFVVAYHVDASHLSALPESWGLALGSPPYTSPNAAEVRALAGDSPLVLVAWSAGCQAVRGLLLAHVDPVAVVALDGAHGSLPVLPWQVSAWADYARGGRLVLTCTQQTYVEGLPRASRYASTLRIASAVWSTLTGDEPGQLSPGVREHGNARVEVHASAAIDADAHVREVSTHLPRILRDIIIPALDTSSAQVAHADAPVLTRGRGALALALAALDAGVRERPAGSNDGDEVRRYLAGCVRKGKRLRLGPCAWCAAFASWCVWSADCGGDEEVLELDSLHWTPANHNAHGGPPIGYRAAVSELVTDARATGRWHDASELEGEWGPCPRSGSLLVYGRNGHDPRRGGEGHVTICERWAWSDGTCAEVSGNDGDRVRRREWPAGGESPHGPLLGWVDVD